MRRPLCIAALVVVATLAPGVAAANPTANASAGAPPPDPESDVLGWEAGYWHNESLDVDQSDGLSERELDAVLRRSMARVEYIRRLEFQRTPTVRFLTREEYGDIVDRAFEQSNVTTADRLHQNVKFEALFLVDEATSYFRTQRRNRASFAAAFYVTQDSPGVDLSEGDLGVVLDGDSLPRVREPTLGHELAHAVQNQVFDSSELPSGNTEDSARAANSVLEGDPSYMEALYQRRCGDQWECLSPPDAGAPPTFANVGLVVYDLFVYGEGPDFVQQVVADGGWERAARLYESPPATTEQVIYPGKYPDQTPREITVEDTSTGEWRIPDTSGGGVDYATFGEAGLFTMLWYPGYAARERVVMGPNAVFTEDDTNPYNFSHPASAGWDGDRLYPYVNDSSATTNETGYVWKLAWDSAADATEFAAAYREVLRFWGGERVGQRTWRLPADRGFGDAIHLRVAGDTVTVVNAPTVADLPEIRSDVTVRETTTTRTPSATSTADRTVTPTTTAGATPTATAGPTGTTTSPGTPGFTPALALVAALVAVALGRRRR